MDNFSYSNIFETKGFEYIAIIAFFIVLVPFWIILNKQGIIKHKIKKVIKILSFDILKIPQGVFYCKNHTWAYMEKSGTASVGLDDFLLHTTGEVQLINLKNRGEIIHQGELLTEVMKDDHLLKMYSPISGEIMSINAQLNENPEFLNNDPMGKGWLYKIKPSKWKNETQTFYIAEDATNWAKMEMQRFKDFLALSGQKYLNATTSPILQDGGELLDHTLSGLPNSVWEDFQENFLGNKDF